MNILNPKVGILLSVFAFSNSASSQSFGVVGEVFPVAEESLLQGIQTRLQNLTESGELDKIYQRWQKQAQWHADRPRPLKLPQAVRKQRHYFRPDIVLETAIHDAKGEVLYPVGTRVNALSHLPDYSPCWLFLNGDHLGEQNWAEKESKACLNPKIILTAGSIHEMEERLHALIYFDQGGVLTQRLGIRATPARVTRHNDTLQIEELVIKENGDVL